MVKTLFSKLKIDSLRALQVFQLLRFASRMILSVVLARVLPGKELIGFYEKLLLIGQLATSFWVSGIIDPLLPYYAAVNSKKQSYLISNAIILLSLISLLACGVLLIIEKSIIHEHFELYHVFILFTLFNAPAFLMEYIFLLRKKSKELLWYGVCVFLMQTLALAIPLLFDTTLYTSLILLGISAMIRYLFLIFYVLKHYGIQFHWEEMRLLSSRTGPYIGSLIIGSSMGYIDSLFVTHYYNDADFAVFSYGALELPFVTLLANSFSNAMSAELASHHVLGNMKEGLAIIKRRSTQLLHLFFPVTIVFLLVSKFLFSWVYTPAFSLSAGIFNVYLLIIISRLLFPHTILLSMQKNGQLFRASAMEWGINVILDAVFIYYFGMLGIAFATLISFMLHKVILAWYCHREGVEFSSYVSVKIWGFYAIVSIVVYFISTLI